MKYQSELIKEIVDSRGHEKSSLHYQSECVETWINETKGAYPKLCDYQSEWINYINENPIGNFPYVTITDVTEATVENVVPYAYKSAILKGQTLVNIKGQIVNIGVLNTQVEFNIPCVKMNTDYFIKYKTTTTSDVLGIGFLESNLKWSKSLENQPSNGAFILNSGNTPNYFRISGKNGTSTIVDELMIIEYQDGMENWDIPYFEGMQSVKMPVLKSVGKNLFDIDSVSIKGNVVIKNNTITITPNGTWQNQAITTISVNCGETYVLSFNNGVDNSNTGSIKIYDGESVEEILIDQSIAGVSGGKVLKFTPNTNKIKVVIEQYGSNGIFIMSDIQIEKGSVATTYEPYKSNILTTPSDLELRGIGEVQDTLDCLTGEVVQKFTTKTYNGSENWILHTASSNLVNCLHFFVNENDIKKNGKAISPQIKTLNYSELTDDEYISIGGSQHLHYKVDKNKLTSQDVNGFKQWLSQNPFTVQYQLATESIKTVDLTITDQDGKTLSVIKPIEGKMYLSTSSNTIKPLFSGEIPVEAIAQNLASFIDLEMEE